MYAKQRLLKSKDDSINSGSGVSYAGDTRALYSTDGNPSGVSTSVSRVGTDDKPANSMNEQIPNKAEVIDSLPLRDANDKLLGHFSAVISFEENRLGIIAFLFNDHK